MTDTPFILRRRPFLARLRRLYAMYRRMFPPARAFREAWRMARF